MTLPSAEQDQGARDLEACFASLNRRLNQLLWMVGVNLAMMVAILWRVFFPHG